jgi:hypothetical protein
VPLPNRLKGNLKKLKNKYFHDEKLPNIFGGFRDRNIFNKNMPEQKQTEIKISDNYSGGEYANAMQVVHSKDEFLLTFLNVVPPSGRVCAKIISSPGHFKRMLTALNDNLKKYEDKFGAIEEAESPKSEIGFKA